MNSVLKKTAPIIFVISLICLFTLVHQSIISSDTDTPYIHSITELNKEAHSPDSHAGVTDRSTLELDYRTLTQLANDALGTGTAHYPQIKKLSDGSYILFYNSNRTKEDCLYIRRILMTSKDSST